MQSTHTDVLPERFTAKVNFDGPEGCWLWTGCKTTGYGRISVAGAMVLAHRMAYELLVGPIESGAVLDHTCFNRACVNPAHLRQASNKQNQEHRAGAQRNSRSGIRGVYWQKDIAKWRVSASNNGRTIYGGVYADKQQADYAARALRARLFTHDDLEGITS